MKFQCLLVTLCFCACALAGKYSREVNEPKHVDGDGRTVEFRIAKLNQVWEKAKRVSVRIRKPKLSRSKLWPRSSTDMKQEGGTKDSSEQNSRHI